MCNDLVDVSINLIIINCLLRLFMFFEGDLNGIGRLLLFLFSVLFLIIIVQMIIFCFLGARFFPVYFIIHFICVSFCLFYSDLSEFHLSYQISINSCHKSYHFFFLSQFVTVFHFYFFNLHLNWIDNIIY